jgi:hypothetical protein
MRNERFFVVWKKEVDGWHSQKCNAILQRKLPQIFKDPSSFTILCSFSKLNIGKALCDLRVNINLMPLSMMKKLDYEEAKLKKNILTLVDHSITFPYRVLEDMLVRVNDLLFPADFVILNMDEDLGIRGKANATGVFISFMGAANSP